MRLGALVVLGCLALPGVAAAEPAVVKVFEAEVHAQPDLSSAVVYVYSEGSRVSVSEQATQGFRRIRLPDGSVGYVQESALAFGAAVPPSRAPPRPPSTAAPSTGPGSSPTPAPPTARDQAVPQTPPPPTAAPTAPPPPPPSSPPPPPRYPGPSYAPPPYPPPRYRPAYADYQRHTGFYLHLDVGLGYMRSSANTAGFDQSTQGLAGSFGIAVGGAIAENLILSAHLWDVVTVAPVKSGGTVLSASDVTSSLVGFGPNLTYYFMPQNVYVSVTPSVTTLVLSQYGYSRESDTGFGGRAAVGKEWWVGPGWGMGVAAQFSFGVAETWSTVSGGVAFSATFN